MALILRNGGSQSPDRWLKEPRNNHEEAEEIVEQMRGGQAMGFLFENMDKMDIQAERRNTQREKERADKAEAEKQQTVEKNLALEKENQQLRAEIEKLKLEQSNRK